MLLIYDDETSWTRMTEAEQGAIYGEYMTFTDDIKKSGHFVAGDPLQATTAATTVRVRDGKTLSTDGPFAETREQLGGYYVVRAADLDEATGLAARIPASRTGSIEIRPIVEM